MKKTITLVLYMYEIMYDIRIKLKKLAESKKDGKNEYYVSRIQDAVDENSNVLLRSVGNAYASLRNELSEYITDESETNKADNTLIEETTADDKDNTLSITLRMPSNYNAATKQEVALSAHQYLVNTALFDWLQQVDKDDAKDYLALSQNNIQKLLSAFYKRMRPTRTPVPTDPDTPSTNTTLKYE